jgi:hypothetical protein
MFSGRFSVLAAQLILYNRALIDEARANVGVECRCASASTPAINAAINCTSQFVCTAGGY